MSEWDGPIFREEVREVLRDAIGVDPDSKGFVCSFVEVGGERVKKRVYFATQEGIKNLVKWVKGEGDIIVAIEGSNGQSKPLEKAFRKEGVVFYSFKPSDVDKFRKAVLGQNKNNERDAESVARYAMALEAQGKLHHWKRVWFPDEELQMLTRSYERTSKELTAELNRLWKLIRAASGDLYLALGGNNPDSEICGNMLKNRGVLTLFAEKPDIFEWKMLSEADFLGAMGERNYKGRTQLIRELQKVSQSFQPIAPALVFMIRSAAQKIRLIKQQLADTVTMLKALTKDNKAVKALEEYPGIGALTASTLVAEIIDIRRFATNDNLACYSGLGMKEHSTGNNVKLVPSRMYNRRLKDAFMTTAKNFVRCNPASHLAGYYKNLLKGGMSVTAARKRVARALVRVIFKRLNALIEEDSYLQMEGERKKRESDMASGITRSEMIHLSNIPLISLLNNNTNDSRKINMEKLEADRRRVNKVLEKA